MLISLFRFTTTLVRDQFLHPWTDQGKDRQFFDDSSGFSLHVSPRFPESLRLAKLLADQLMGSGLHFTTAHELKNPVGAKVPWFDSTRGIYRRDWLVVLRNTNMPAVLLEAGVIVNRDEELLVSTPAYQTTIATAIVEAVRKFCKRERRGDLPDRQRGAPRCSQYPLGAERRSFDCRRHPRQWPRHSDGRGLLRTVVRDRLSRRARLGEPPIPGRGVVAADGAVRLIARIARCRRRTTSFPSRPRRG